MNRTKKTRAAKILSLAIVLAGCTAVIGWLFDLTPFKIIFPAWISMKFDTAVGFVLCGIILYFMARSAEGERDLSQVAISISTLMLVLLMGVLFFSDLLGINTGIEELFIKDRDSPAMTVVPGRPAVATIVNFMLIAMAGIVTLLHIDKLRLKPRFIGALVLSIGALAVAGYCFNSPFLYYFMEGTSSAMPLSTAGLFVLSGAGLICLSK